MTANHAHTPSLDQMRDLYVRHADQLGIASDHVLHAEFDRFLAAAEQRGAARALRQAALEWSRAGNDANVYAWLHYRADLLEGDDD